MAQFVGLRVGVSNSAETIDVPVCQANNVRRLLPQSITIILRRADPLQSKSVGLWLKGKFPLPPSSRL
jgi:hypothetical protein